ncbi:lipopolysaccharide transport periplasmic protein LptA [Pseudohaliea rubra]|uniref:Lipopolysaccharide export system protein LptA n=1 Tax=Pseudohaliea rubra DSM 19751 TaxID=1265313 RepID=A0A095XU70_9GAMM|nr:lipopolysaccharide transport periplasmic protein LptA [Pseudohaliea rubra]KGE03226.1 LptA, protein essential for LPS transport across the periplasm [Pseudohaliea rubra DSM 19751]
MRRAAGPLLAMTLLLAPPVQALPEDREQSIAVEADRAVRDEKAGQTVYSGAVRLVQGSLIIEADKLTIFHSRDLAERVVAIGAPARMQQQPALDEAVIHANARRITYFTAEERVLLEESAEVEQDGATVSGDRIDYLIREQLVRADAAESGGDRVQVVIPPRLAEDAEAPATDNAGAAGGPAADAQDSAVTTDADDAGEPADGPAEGE